MIKTLCLCLLLVLMAQLTACDDSSPQDCAPIRFDPILQNPEVEPLCFMEPAGACPGEMVLVESVYDGDTITLSDGSRIRMLGIQAPEIPKGADLANPNANVETCLGLESASFLRDLIENETVCLMDPVDGRQNDPFGRRLAYIYYGGYNINAFMITSGHACAFPRYKEPMCLQDLITAQDEAEIRGQGIWGICKQIHKDPCANSR